MRLPRFRFIIRRMMIAVAIVAAAIGATRLAQTQRVVSREYQRRADFCEYALLKMGWRPEQGDQDSRRYGRLLGLRTKYQRAARYPWLPVAPDPPEPE